MFRSRRSSQLDQPGPPHPAENDIAKALGGGDALPAWNAVWDLAQSNDTAGKREVLAAIKGYIDTAVAGEPVEQAQAFGDAIEQSLKPTKARQSVMPSPEVRKHYRDDQAEATRQAMRNIGVRDGEGLPMWVMYMSRRSKKSFGA